MEDMQSSKDGKEPGFIILDVGRPKDGQMFKPFEMIRQSHQDHVNFTAKGSQIEKSVMRKFHLVTIPVDLEVLQSLVVRHEKAQDIY